MCKKGIFFFIQSLSGLANLLVYLEQTCVGLDPIENSYFESFKSSYDIGTVIKFECDYGYKIEGASSISCTSNGWSDEQPLCVGMLVLYFLLMNKNANTK